MPDEYKDLGDVVSDAMRAAAKRGINPGERLALAIIAAIDTVPDVALAQRLRAVTLTPALVDTSVALIPSILAADQKLNLAFDCLVKTEVDGWCRLLTISLDDLGIGDEVRDAVTTWLVAQSPVPDHPGELIDGPTAGGDDDAR